MGKSFVVILIFLLLGLGGYAIYTLAPQLIPRVDQISIIISSINKDKSDSVTPTPSQIPTETQVPIQKNNFSDSLIITEYLEKNLGIQSQNGEIFCVYNILSDYENQPSRLYLLVLCQEYYQSGGVKLPGSGMVVPTVLELKWENQTFSITAHSVPELGSGYTTSLKNLFPTEISNYLLSDLYSADVNLLQKKIDSVVY